MNSTEAITESGKIRTRYVIETINFIADCGLQCSWLFLSFKKAVPKSGIYLKKKVKSERSKDAFKGIKMKNEK